jgi:hypothetical protein
MCRDGILDQGNDSDDGWSVDGMSICSLIIVMPSVDVLNV